MGRYQDAGKSGKSIEGRPEFQKMLGDIESGRCEAEFVPLSQQFVFLPHRIFMHLNPQINRFTDMTLIFYPVVKILNIPTTLADFDGQEWVLEMVNNILIEVMGSMAEEERLKARLFHRQAMPPPVCPPSVWRLIPLHSQIPYAPYTMLLPAFTDKTVRKRRGISLS